MSLQVVFVHPNYPAQFGHIAKYLVQEHGFRCRFVSQRPPGVTDGVERIQYQLKSGATKQTHYCSRTFENAIWNSHAVYEALKARLDIKPDLIVAHSGFLSTIFLRELYDCAIVNYFEYFYRTKDSDMDFRPDFPVTEMSRLRARARNAALLLDLESCDIGYSPTLWQRNRLPAIFHHKVRAIFDGIDTNLWKPYPDAPRTISGRSIPPEMKIVTYVSRGMESMRGFDIFMEVAKRLCDRRNDVIFIVAGEDRVCYGGDDAVTGEMSFKEWVLSKDHYDLSRFIFTGLLPTQQLAQLLSITDLHIYLTVPFVLSWSLLNALSCGATILASNTAPVCEMIEHGKNGLLTEFFDIDAWVETADRVLNAPLEFKHFGRAGTEMIREKYDLEVCLPQMLELYQEALTTHKD